MAGIPDGDGTPIIRTDFTDEAAWRSVVEAVEAGALAGEGPSFSWVEDRGLAELAPSQVVARAKGSRNMDPSMSGMENAIAFIADAETMDEPDHPLLCVDLLLPGRSFRLIPEEVWTADANLSLANMDFEDFLDALDSDGVFRGFQP